ncbi:hypothetical protein PPSIR1_00045 [Plesiocystis pacifica SIR-1]|uniref:eCIS core domain-containing protein n=1 Tax=Plesiocystis pacifica SIR-1 TaxID=391625 RepID=A6GJF9_9BACT|nr:DUF4157 domain-containing protein [Plesiocystis pacifica]EDM73999.1 hypothetical protein PPSIR1_00045 [Plesiocystis pacifica SIR-1]
MRTHAAPGRTRSEPVNAPTARAQAKPDSPIQRHADASAPVQTLASLQRLADDSPRVREQVQDIASEGVSGPGSSYPHAARIQSAFGRHSITGMRAHMGETAKQSAQDLGARAYATQGQVAFGRASPGLFDAAHEAAHVMQQRAGVAPGGLSSPGDRWERHADTVAEAVTAGRSAESLLDSMPGGRMSAGSGSGSGSGSGANSGSGSNSNSVQRRGETAAVMGSKNAGYRRGNRRGSITNTQGESRAKMDYARKLTSDKEGGYRRGVFRDYTKEQALALVPGLNEDGYAAWFTANEMHVSRVVYDVLRGANCGDFAFGTGSRLIQATTGQWVHYGAMKDPYDHAFALTYSERIRNGDLPRRVNKKKALIADTWADNLVTTLEEFMAGDNPYSDVLSNSDIEIKRGLLARGQTVYNQEFPQLLRTRLATKATTMWQEDHFQQTEWKERAMRERTNSDVFDFPTTQRMNVRFKNGTQLFPHLTGLNNQDRDTAINHWNGHDGACFDWDEMPATLLAIEGLIAIGGTAQTKTYSLMNALDNNGKRQSMLRGLDVGVLWTYLDNQNILNNSSWNNSARSGGKPTMRHVVRRLGDTRLACSRPTSTGRRTGRPTSCPT